MKKGFSLIELLVVIFIIAIIGALIATSVGGCSKDPVTGKSYYNVEHTGTYRCVKTYTIISGSGDTTSASKRVDLKEVTAGGDEISQTQTFNVDDNFRADVYNSGTLFAQFEEGKYYNVTSVGFRKEGWNGFFPLVIDVIKVPDPTVKSLDSIQAEVSESDF